MKTILAGMTYLAIATGMVIGLDFCVNTREIPSVLYDGLIIKGTKYPSLKIKIADAMKNNYISWNEYNAISAEEEIFDFKKSKQKMIDWLKEVSDV